MINITITGANDAAIIGLAVGALIDDVPSPTPAEPDRPRCRGGALPHMEGGGPGHGSGYRAGRQARSSIRRSAPLAADRRSWPEPAASSEIAPPAFAAGGAGSRAWPCLAEIQRSGQGGHG